MAVVKLEYLYREEIAGVVGETGQQCPPASASSVEVEAFRFVQSPVSDKCMLPPGVRQPRRVLDASAHRLKCSLLGLSMFGSEDAARARYSILKRSVRNIGKTLGTHVAKCSVGHEDGVATPLDQSGHFDLFEFSASALSRRITIVGEL